MIEIDLCRAIRTRSEEILKDLIIPADRGFPDRSPSIINGFLPPKRSKAESDFPFVVVRPGEGNTNANRLTRATVKMLVGCYSEDFDGHEYALLVLARLRTGLMECPTLESRYRMELPFSWRLYDDQPYPNWELEITTEWSIATPLEIPDDGVIGYGPEED